MPSSNPLLRKMVGWIPYDVIPMGSASNQQLKPFNQVQVLRSSSSAGATLSPSSPSHDGGPQLHQQSAVTHRGFRARHGREFLGSWKFQRNGSNDRHKEALSLVLMDQRAL